jgi:hypothetical protein
MRVLGVAVVVELLLCVVVRIVRGGERRELVLRLGRRSYVTTVVE